jgi:glutathione S-transferase
MAPLVLYQLWYCPWCAAARQALANMEVEHVVVEVSPEREERHDVLELTGQTKVPAIVDGTTVVWDSHTIVSYLYEKHRGWTVGQELAHIGGRRELDAPPPVPAHARPAGAVVEVEEPAAGSGAA